MPLARSIALSLALLIAGLVPPRAAAADQASFNEKINAYVACINRLSARSYESRSRYFSWAAKSGPTGKERIIYGTYTIYETGDCKKGVEKANTLEPRDPALEAAASAYVDAVVTLEPLLKEADDYYDQQNYKDDKMAKGKALHPRLVAAWDAFAAADQKLRGGIEELQEARAADRLAEIERTEGRKALFHRETLMMRAKKLYKAQNVEKPDLAKVTEALNSYEAIVKDTEAFLAANKDAKIGSSFVSSSKSYLTTAKQLMRRVRDNVPYSQGDRMMLNAGGGWMVEGSPPRLTRDYNQLIDDYNRGGTW